MKFFLVFTVALVAGGTSGENLTRYVHTEMGTVNVRGNNCEVSCGNVYPLVAMPWGFGGWSPETRPAGTSMWFYEYTDAKITGIRYTRQPSPWIGDCGAWSIMPVTGKPRTNAVERGSWVSHKTEIFSPAEYSVFLSDYDTSVAITPTMHGAVAKVTYREGAEAGLVVNPYKGGEVSGSAARVEGVSRWLANWRNGGAKVEMHFVLECDREFETERLADGALYLKFGRTANDVEIRMAVSFISAEQAVENLKETEGGFAAVKAAAEKEWNERLGRIRTESGDEKAKETFYSCFYRTMLFPQAVWEKTNAGKIVHWSPSDGKVYDGYYYAGTGFWDTFRALYPLVNLLFPEMNAKMMEGLEHCWKESGWLPEWSAPGLSNCMIGNNSASVVADAYLSGVRGRFDIEELWKALVHGAENAHPKMEAVGRCGAKEYLALGYVPRDIGIHHNAARTLEYAYDDWCLYRLAEALGKQDEAEKFRRRSENWKNVMHPEKKIACGRNRDGSFNKDFNPLSWGGDFTEGNAYHWTWSVFHDVSGLMAVMGGEKEFERRLDEIFALPASAAEYSYYHGPIHEFREMQIAGMGQYAHGTQPIQHMIYLYDWCGEWGKAQQRAREVMDRLYRPTPDGYCGDEDNGQTSAWYVWSALGMYPVCPASGEYALGAPRFDRIEVTLPDGKRLNIVADGAEGKTVFTRTSAMDGDSMKPFVTLKQIKKGGTLQWLK